MAKDTLLDIVQTILSEADGDEVNSISDTIESDQVARVVQSEFYTIVDEFDLKTHETYRKLDATTVATPTIMTRPEGVHSIEQIWYDRRTSIGGDPRFEEVSFRPPREFIELTMSRTASDAEVDTLVLPDSTFVLQIRNDRAPVYWTVLEGYDQIIFDSYDSNVDSTLQQSKSLVRCVQRPTLVLADSTVPDLPQNLMTLLRARARAFYFDIYKDGMTPGVARRERHAEVRSQRKKYITKNLQEERTGRDFGRRPRARTRITNVD